MKLIAYYRVSTDRQGDSGLGLEAQKTAIAGYVASRQDAVIVAEYVEVQSSVKRRPELEEALAALADEQADGLVVSKLDRLVRSVRDLYDLIERARREGWTLIILDLGLDLMAPMGEAMAGMVAIFAQLERRLIGERTKVALAAARERGVVLGRPRDVDDDVVERVHAMREQRMTFRAIAAELNADGVPTARGGAQWHPSTVKGIVEQRC